MKQSQDPTIKKCAYCDKEFYTGLVDNWAYKEQQKNGRFKYFCRYTHLTAYRRERGDHRPYRNLVVGKCERNGEGKK